MNADRETVLIIYMKSNKMRRLITFLTLFVAAAALLSCVDPEKRILSLEADKTEVVADGTDQVAFTVTYSYGVTEDVTATADITCINGDAVVTDGIFTPEEEGTYVFQATYEGVTSDLVEITVTKPAESRFRKHTCVMEFTGGWCSQCPEGATTLNYLVSKAYKDKAFALAFHNADPFAIPQEQELFKKFKLTGYPSYVTDMRDSGLLNEGTCSKTIDASLYDHPTHCAVAVKCTYDAASQEVTVKASLYSEKTSQYSFAVYVAEDKVKGSQTLSTGEVQDDYVHRHVVRMMLSSDVNGDSLGSVEAGKETGKTYTFKVDDTWNIGNLSVAVLALDENSEVNNMATCAADGGEMQYESI